MNELKRGDVYYADLSPVIGSEQSGIRPVLIVQNDVGNKHSPTTIAVAITSRKNKLNIPTHVEIKAKDAMVESIILTEQIRTIDKARLGRYICTLSENQMKNVDRALHISLDLRD